MEYFGSQRGGLNLFRSMIEEMKPVKYLETAIIANLGENSRHIIGEASSFKVACLAIDVLGGSDPEFLLNLYGQGAKIEDDIVGDLATAVIWAQRKKTDAAEEFAKLREKHDR